MVETIASMTPAPQRSGQAFLSALRDQRARIYRHMTTLEDASRLAAFVFDLFTRLAQSNQSQLEPATIERLNDQLGRFDEPPSQVRLTLPSGIHISLEQALTMPAPPRGTTELVNALFAQGYALYLESKPPAEQRSFTGRVIKLLPGIERLGPFILSDFIDTVCGEEDALRFWQLYVERVASELGRRTNAQGRNDTWTLSSLLQLDEGGASRRAGRRNEVLKRHIHRIIQSNHPEWRWRFVRALAEACQDDLLLYQLCSSPAVLEDPEVSFIFLTRCNSKLVSCAIFMLHKGSGKKPLLARVLKYFKDKELPEIGERLVEVYAQTQLFEHPSQLVTQFTEQLLELLRSFIENSSEEQPAQVILNAIKNDGRAFRQALLLHHLVPENRFRTTESQKLLLERVQQSFFHAFTPSGVRHPLNDERYRQSVALSLVELIRSNQGGSIETLRSFGFGLEQAALRWLPNDEDASKRELLLSYFIGLYAETLRSTGRILYHQPDLKDYAIQLYRALVQLFLSKPKNATESNGYGGLGQLLIALYPELISQEYAEEPNQARVEEVTQLFAEIEAESYQRMIWLDPLYHGGSGKGVETEVEEEAEGERPQRVQGTEEKSSARQGISFAGQRAEARVELIPKRPTTSRSVLRAFLGVDLAAWGIRSILHLLGVRRRGRLLIEGEQVAISEEYRSGEQRMGQESYRFPTTALNGVKVHQPLRAFYLVAGFMGLVTFSFFGGHLLLAAARGGELVLASLGGGVMGLAYLFDSAMHALHERARGKLIVELYCQQMKQPLALAIDRQNGSALIDTLLTWGAEQREHRFNQDWSELVSTSLEESAEEEEEA